MSVDFYVEGELGESANFSNTNARLLLAAIGIPSQYELVGSADPADLIARIDKADANSAVRDTESLPSTDGKVHMVICGQDHAAVVRKLAAIRHIAQKALSLGKKVVWA